MSRLILAVDTSSANGSLALLRGGELLEEVPIHAPDGFAHVLYRHLGDLLERHSLKTADIDCFAAASGPGSFTGVRIGLACVKGLAEAVGRSAVAVSNLAVIAWFGAAPLRAPLMDARRGEVYGAVYDAAGGLVVPESVGPFGPWLDTLPEGDLEFVTLDFVPPLTGTRFERVMVRSAPRVLAGAVARLAAKATPCDPAALDANYVRRSDAELMWKE